MAYNCYFSCDKCGDGFYWTNYTVSYNRAITTAREKGWTVGKRGWYCPECRKRRQSEDAKRRGLNKIGIEARRKKGGGEDG